MQQSTALPTPGQTGEYAMHTNYAIARTNVRRRFSRIALLVLLATTLLVTLLSVSGCGRRRQAEVDVFEPYRAAMKEEFHSDFDLVQTAPRYAIDVVVSPSYDLLTGTASIHFTNNSPDPLRHIVFRLYPVLDHYGGNMRILSALANGEATQFVYQAENTAVQVNLQEPLPPEDEAVIQLSWRLTIPDLPDSPSTYALFGNSQGITSLPLFYPSLAVYEPGPAIGTGHWWLEMGSVRGDSAFNETGLFTVTAALPAEAVPVATGTLVASTTVSADQTIYTWVTGPVREFLIHMSPNFESLSMDAYGTRVNSYYLPGDEESAQDALEHAVGALRFFSDYFGGYPFKEMSIAPAALSYRGMEYPQISLLGVSLYDEYRDDLETLTAHEIAHQWWYQIVHNDPVRMPWLDEGLAEYSMGAYFEALHGERMADLVEFQRWQIPLDLLRDNHGDAGMNKAVDDYESGSQYETIIYAKGALLYEEIYDKLGDRAFREMLRSYLKDNRYEIVDTQDWLEAMEPLGQLEVERLYNEWIAPVEIAESQTITDSISVSQTSGLESLELRTP